jgi:hypothetical protein
MRGRHIPPFNLDRTAEHDELIARIPLGPSFDPSRQTARMVEAKVTAAKTELHKVQHRRRSSSSRIERIRPHFGRVLL